MFTFFMLVLVTGDNFLLLFLGWEGELNCLTWDPNLLNMNILLFYRPHWFFIFSGKVKNQYSSIKSSLIGEIKECTSNFGKCNFHIPGKIHSHKRIGPHNIDILQIMYGTLLGDGHLEKRSKGIGTRLILEQTSRNVEYLMWLYNQFFLRGYCTNSKPKLFTRIMKNNTVYYGYKFNTFTFSSLNWLHELFYIDGIKHIPIIFLSEYLSPLALAIWFMDDGSKLNTSFKIATNCFEYNELVLFCDLLKKKYNLDCSLHKDKSSWTFYIKKSTAQNFANLIEPHMINSMKYKLGSYSQHKQSKVNLR
jgi:ubiquinol-cytochrome c reductase cytochrome b subunit